MDIFYKILRESLNEETGKLIDAIYKDYQKQDDFIEFALSCEKVLRLYYGIEIHQEIEELLVYVLYTYLDYAEDRIELVLNEYDPEHNRYIQ